MSDLTQDQQVAVIDALEDLTEKLKGAGITADDLARTAYNGTEITANNGASIDADQAAAILSNAIKVALNDPHLDPAIVNQVIDMAATGVAPETVSAAPPEQAEPEDNDTISHEELCAEIQAAIDESGGDPFAELEAVQEVAAKHGLTNFNITCNGP